MIESAGRHTGRTIGQKILHNHRNAPFRVVGGSHTITALLPVPLSTVVGDYLIVAAAGVSSLTGFEALSESVTGGRVFGRVLSSLTDVVLPVASAAVAFAVRGFILRAIDRDASVQAAGTIEHRVSFAPALAVGLTITSDSGSDGLGPGYDQTVQSVYNPLTGRRVVLGLSVCDTRHNFDSVSTGSVVDHATLTLRGVS